MRTEDGEVPECVCVCVHAYKHTILETYFADKGKYIYIRKNITHRKIHNNFKCYAVSTSNSDLDSYFFSYNYAADMSAKSHSRSLETLNLDWLQEDIG